MINDLLKITEELMDLLQQENALLKKRKLAQACLLHNEKDKLNGEYQLAVLRIKSDRNYFKSLSQEAIEDLNEKTIHVKKVLEENRDLITMISSANRRILHALVEKFSASSPAVPVYSAFGSVKTIKTKSLTFTINTCV